MFDRNIDKQPKPTHRVQPPRGQQRACPSPDASWAASFHTAQPALAANWVAGPKSSKHFFVRDDQVLH
jgi:hypothetical protein